MYFLRSIEEAAPIIHSGENLSWWRPICGYEADIWLRICVGADEQLDELQGVQMMITARIAGQQGYIFLSIDEGNIWFNHKFCGIEGYGRMPDGTHQ